MGSLVLYWNGNGLTLCCLYLVLCSFSWKDPFSAVPGVIFLTLKIQEHLTFWSSQFVVRFLFSHLHCVKVAWLLLYFKHLEWLMIEPDSCNNFPTFRRLSLFFVNIDFRTWKELDFAWAWNSNDCFASITWSDQLLS